VNTDSIPVHAHSVSGKKTSSTGNHVHALTSVDAALAIMSDRITALATRVASLEGTTPVPDPEPPPTTGRPFAAPVTTRTVTVPTTIDATGATDVTAALQAFIDSVPDGSIIAFPGGKTYKTSGMLNLQGRANLIIDGAGSALNNVANANVNGAYGSYWFSTFGWSWTGAKPSHITIRNLNGLAASPAPGVLQPAEHAGFLLAMGGSYIELDNITSTGQFGDGLAEVNENPDHVWFHNCRVVNCGRNGVSVVCGSEILIEECAFDVSGYCTFDIEPEPGSIAGVNGATFRNNTAGTWTDTFFSMDRGSPPTGAGKLIQNITVTGNVATGRSLRTQAGASAATVRPQNVSFTDNRSTVAGPGPVLNFWSIDTLTVTGNSQPVSSGPLVAVSGCTNVVTSPNP
jgi:hypothetical protein